MCKSAKFKADLRVAKSDRHVAKDSENAAKDGEKITGMMDRP